MRFSLIFEAQTVDASRRGERQVFDELVEQAILAENLGFDVVWSVEHTSLTHYAHMSAPETFLAYIAGKTSRIGIGHGVVCLMPAMNHPIKVAERIATLDILSKGRVHFGIGKGGSQQEAGAYGHDLKTLQPMIDESMYLIPKMFVQDEVEHNGTYFQIPPRPIHPKPYQEPHPPMYMACTNLETLARAGERGLGALVLGFGGPSEVAAKNDIYRTAWDNRALCDQVGYRPIQHLAALCPTIVLNDRDEARRIGIRGQRYFYESLNYWYGGGPRPDPDSWGSELVEEGTNRIITTQLASETLTMELKPDEGGRRPSNGILSADNAYGTVDDCINYVEQLIAAGADEILFMTNMGTVPQWAQLETLRKIGTYVIPHFR
ncbi:MAG: LLM class flavin-dependent oxidoreductase [Sphingobium sp.]|uniref:LLM class flavin-dependent oxidoreductase n=1 Tax=Sphingobium sp. CECT 9361 TaxID=2845384 RepID=UPI001E42BD77|nr:LLM class flavin-dependent oxidoreductase [Sphingobium sp. CECT 9361]CAH0351213.1 F420-dependent glucose-6-phosphate dehydrogenase [Sphingobium sp. CECT 9361]|tara:strand:+ start:5974 stop:7104 length:1131 start_codon:yes stop_codon:yes gene_type:complete